MRGAGRRVRCDFLHWETSEQHQRRKWAGPAQGHDPPEGQAGRQSHPAAHTDGWDRRPQYRCLWTGQENVGGDPVILGK